MQFRVLAAKIKRKMQVLLEPVFCVCVAGLLFVCSAILFQISYSASLFPFAIITQQLTFVLALIVIPIGVAFLVLAPIVWRQKK